MHPACHRRRPIQCRSANLFAMLKIHGKASGENVGGRGRAEVEVWGSSYLESRFLAVTIWVGCGGQDLLDVRPYCE